MNGVLQGMKVSIYAIIPFLAQAVSIISAEILFSSAEKAEGIGHIATEGYFSEKFLNSLMQTIRALNKTFNNSNCFLSIVSSEG